MQKKIEPTSTAVTRNPVNGELLKVYPQHAPGQVEAILSGNLDAGRIQRDTPMVERVKRYKPSAETLRYQFELLAIKATSEGRKAIASAFTRKYVKTAMKVKVGDPLDESWAIGPIASGDLRDGVHDEVKCSDASGATSVLTSSSTPRASGSSARNANLPRPCLEFRTPRLDAWKAWRDEHQRSVI
jgi:acyl-CoA reductase-like NAD-dependent aldehyde dehydrogenase